MDRTIPRGYVMSGIKAGRNLLFRMKPRAFVLAVLIEVVLVLGVLFTVGLTPALAQQSGEIEWIRQFGSPSEDWAVSISAHSSGVYVFGDIEGALPGQTSLGAQDVYVRKYRPNGKKVWTRQFGTTLKDFARGISVNSTGVYLAGQTKGPLPGQEMVGSHDAFVRKYTFNGKEVWTRQFGSSIGAGASAIAVGSTGVYVAGSAEAPLPGQTSVGGFVRKYDTNGTHIWTHHLGAPETRSGRARLGPSFHILGLIGTLLGLPRVVS